MNSIFRFIRQVFAFLWRALEQGRRVFLNLLFALLVILLVVAVVQNRPVHLQAKTTLVLDLDGPIVEATPHKLGLSLLEQGRDGIPQPIVLRDVLEALEGASHDAHITQVLLNLDGFEGAGLPTLREVAAGIDRVKAAGKPVVAWSHYYDQRSYYLASHASQVFVHPMGVVFFRGFGGLRNYYRDGLDKLGVSVAVVKVGKYKSFAEPFIGNGPSQEAAEAENFLLQNLWSTYVADVEGARKLHQGLIMDYVNRADDRLHHAQGKGSLAAVEAALVDGLKTPDELTHYLKEHGAADSNEEDDYRRVDLYNYLATLKPKTSGNHIAVLVAEGDIEDGDSMSGLIGGKTLSSLIRDSRQDHDVKALVLRVKSPGGSAYGAELIRRELELAREQHLPVVVSMGDVAASGGYWISLAADKVLADPATVTGSIGVFALLPNFEKGFGKLGLHASGQTTTWLGNALDPRKPLDGRALGLLQQLIDASYADFTGKVAAARHLPLEKMDTVAQGRVWSGTQALERGLVDQMGGLNDAIEQAATLAHVGKNYQVDYVEQAPGRWEQWLDRISVRVAAVLHRPNLSERMEARLLSQDPGFATMEKLLNQTQASQPFAILDHCFCTAP
jgi:protease-4